MDRVIVADLSPRAWAVAIRLQPQNEGPTGQLDANLRTAVPDPPLPMKRAIFRPYDARAGQMATVSECRYRWLRAPATKLTKYPSNLNGLLGCCSGFWNRPNNINGLACRFKSPATTYAIVSATMTRSPSLTPHSDFRQFEALRRRRLIPRLSDHDL